jgi:leader peptidase (prepilin peptidase)/N-methyltransferase
MTLPMTPGLLAIGAFLFGAVIGSFLNVVIYRLPRGMSLVRPRSRCPACDTPVPVWANVPIVSWIVLRGKCRACGAGIDVRYLLVEVATASLFASLLLHRGPEAGLLADWVVGAVLIAVAFIDGEHRVIPDPLTLPLIPLGVALAIVDPPPGWMNSLAGVGIGGGMLWALSALYEWRAGRVGLGMGDVKLVAMLGAYLGLYAALGIMVIGSLIGLAQGVWMLLRRRGGRTTPIPFGPALCGAGLLHLYTPGWILHLSLGAFWS